MGKQSSLRTHRESRKRLLAKHQRDAKINENTRTAQALQLDEFRRTESVANERTKSYDSFITLSLLYCISSSLV